VSVRESDRDRSRRLNVQVHVAFHSPYPYTPIHHSPRPYFLLSCMQQPSDHATAGGSRSSLPETASTLVVVYSNDTFPPPEILSPRRGLSWHPVAPRIQDQYATACLSSSTVGDAGALSILMRALLHWCIEAAQLYSPLSPVAITPSRSSFR
jgi:hypothetical protein